MASARTVICARRRAMPAMAAGLLLFLLSCLAVRRAAAAANTSAGQATRCPLTSVLAVGLRPGELLRMDMGSSREIALRLTFEKSPAPAGDIALQLGTRTVSPQFNILTLDPATVQFVVSRAQLTAANYVHEIRVKLHAQYIGHALLQLKGVDVEAPNGKCAAQQLEVTIVQHEGVWGVIFIVCVALFMLISYVNLGAQLDMDNMRALVRRPKSLVLGALISVLVMPLVSYLVAEWLLARQPLFRVGAFIFAAGPAASASTLWTVMLNSDKELSVGLQVLSTVGALFTMPLLLYVMDRLQFATSGGGGGALASHMQQQQQQHVIRVPYARLMQTLFALLVALLVGWRFVGRYPRAQKLSRKIFRPLVFSVLIFIVVFSSILYWHIYKMFDWTITLAALTTTMLTYMISGVLGHLIECDLERAVAIAIGSAYKNSGIAFAVLLVAFDAPDTYIAYVPCLTQILITSITLYLSYLALSLYNCARRRGQPDAIRASDPETGAGGGARAGAQPEAVAAKRWMPRRASKTNSELGAGEGAGNKSPAQAARSEAADADELIAMNVTDIEPEPAQSGQSTQTAGGGGATGTGAVPADDAQLNRQMAAGFEDAQASVRVLAGGQAKPDDDDESRHPGTRV